MQVFTDYKEAYSHALKSAKALNLDYGIEKRKEYGKQVFSVKLLPPPDKCQGHELFMERVTPRHV